MLGSIPDARLIAAELHDTILPILITTNGNIINTNNYYVILLLLLLIVITNDNDDIAAELNGALREHYGSCGIVIARRFAANDKQL